MTTKESPEWQIDQQANRIAAMMKKAERGAPITQDTHGKIAAARKIAPGLDTAVVMDGKILKIYLSWEKIRETTQAGIAAWVKSAMMEERAKQ